MRKYHFDECFFDAIDSELKAYWLGFILADGTVFKKQLCIHLKNTDKPHLLKIAGIFNIPVKDGSSYDKRTNKRYYWSRIIISSKHICDSLKAIGVVSNKSLVNCSAVFNHIPESLLHHFVRGYFDGDGCISNNYKNEYVCTFVGERKLLLTIRGLLSKTIGLSKNKIGNRNKIGCLAYGGNFQVIKLREWLYKDATVFLERKKLCFEKVLYHNGRKFRGTVFDKRYSTWRARIYFSGQNHWIGSGYKTQLEAAIAYNEYIMQKSLKQNRLNII